MPPCSTAPAGLGITYYSVYRWDVREHLRHSCSPFPFTTTDTGPVRMDSSCVSSQPGRYQDGRIRVWRHRSECTLAASIRLRHTGPSSGVMVRGAIGYTFRSPLVRIDGTLNSARYISGVLRPVVLPFIRALRNPMIQQDNARPHVAGIVRNFLDTENFRLLPWPACSPDLSQIENFCSMVAERLTRHHTPVAAVDEL
ncbi:uncharacterized protein TNCV_4577671 [Trichonephila clavipes]|nr:uncharacterized protein TNCV_4577671 [Trichonephila clavipes]